MPTLEQLHRLLELDPGDAFTLYAIAQEHAKRGETAPAVEYFDRCLGADADYVYAYFHKARALAAGGKQADAVATARAGRDRARAIGESHAESELIGLLEELEP